MLWRPNLNRYFLRWVVRFRAHAGICQAALGGLFLYLLLYMGLFFNIIVEMFGKLVEFSKKYSLYLLLFQLFLLFLQSNKIEQ